MGRINREEWRRYGRLDILVNNAGISGSSVGDPDGLEGWHRIIAVNQTSVFLGTKLAAERMAKTGGGSIVNISSIMGFVGGASGHPAYSASKGAVRIYTKSAAVRYGPLGIRVNSVHPGYMPPMLNATNANERADKIALTPLGRLGEPIEVAYGVLFLASDEASFVTGDRAGDRRRLHRAVRPPRAARLVSALDLRAASSRVVRVRFELNSPLEGADDLVSHRTQERRHRHVTVGDGDTMAAAGAQASPAASAMTCALLITGTASKSKLSRV